MRRLLLAALTLVSIAVPALAQGWRWQRQVPLFVRLEGRVGPPSDATKGAEDWQLDVGQGKRERFQVVRLIVMGGDASSGDVIHALEPYKPQLRLHGGKGVVTPLIAARADQDVTILGYIQGTPGSARMMVSRVDVKDVDVKDASPPR